MGLSIEWKSFRKILSSVGNMIIGKRTYDIMKKDNEFKGLKGVRIVVVGKGKDSNIAFVKSPKAALKLLKKKFNKALVCGGGILNGSFMEQGLIDELYVDVEPTIFSPGIPLFHHGSFEAELELLEICKLSRNELQLHYKVKH